MGNPDWERQNKELLEHLADSLRSELWTKVGLKGPVAPGDIGSWLWDRALAQKREGDRLRLYLPGAVARQELEKRHKRPRELARARGEAYFSTLGEPIRHHRGRYCIDAYAGGYDLEEDLGDPTTQQWPNSFQLTLIQDLAAVALGAREVQRLTGAELEDGLLFLLSDEPCGARFRMSISDGGLRIWAADALVPAKELGALYVDFRRAYTRRNRPKRPEAHTGDLIRFVQELRPHMGRHASGNLPWNGVLERWNKQHPCTHPDDSAKRRRAHFYLDEDSMRRAYAQALRRRERLEARGLL